MDSPVTESDDTGVSAALEKIISLESRLRQAIQNSHPLSSSFDRDAASADREREALLAVGYAQTSFTIDLQQGLFPWHNGIERTLVIGPNPVMIPVDGSLHKGN